MQTAAGTSDRTPAAVSFVIYLRAGQVKGLTAAHQSAAAAYLKFGGTEPLLLKEVLHSLVKGTCILPIKRTIPITLRHMDGFMILQILSFFHSRGRSGQEPGCCTVAMGRAQKRLSLLAAAGLRASMAEEWEICHLHSVCSLRQLHKCVTLKPAQELTRFSGKGGIVHVSIQRNPNPCTRAFCSAA